FNAYHPDLCYVQDGSGGIIRGPLGDYHSVLALCSFNLGLSVGEARGLFNRRTYEELGWLDLWAPAKERLLKTFGDEGIHLEKHFPKWGRIRAFMHSINHPSIECLYDVAASLLAKFGVAVNDAGLLPHDNLLNGPVFP